MYYLVNRYFSDLSKVRIKKNGQIIPITNLTITEFYNFVRRIPYRKDIKPVEIIARPKIILKNLSLGMDCKKKGILISSFIKSKYGDKIPYRFMTTSNKKSGRIHHIFPQVFINGEWVNLDATYSHYKPFKKKLVTNFEVV